MVMLFLYYLVDYFRGDGRIKFPFVSCKMYTCSGNCIQE